MDKGSGAHDYEWQAEVRKVPAVPAPLQRALHRVGVKADAIANCGQAHGVGKELGAAGGKASQRSCGLHIVEGLPHHPHDTLGGWRRFIVAGDAVLVIAVVTAGLESSLHHHYHAKQNTCAKRHCHCPGNTAVPALGALTTASLGESLITRCAQWSVHTAARRREVCATSVGRAH